MANPARPDPPPRQVPLCRPSIGPAEVKAVVDALTSGWLTHGEHNARFEEELARFVGVEHAVSMNSCTSALEVALQAAGIAGEVVVPSFTWVATANAVVNAGASPVFCEVDPPTRNVTAATIADRVTSRTEAVIVVHYGGQICAMDEIVELCRSRGLLLVEDSAETIGATWRGRQAGSFGVGCFSFFPTKNITTAEGGMLVCDDRQLATRARSLVAHGIDAALPERASRPWWRAASLPGHNYRMPNPLAALGRVQLSRLQEMNERRRRLAARYDTALGGVALELPRVREGATHVYQMYTVEVDPAARDGVVQHLQAQGVGASVHFDPPVHQHPYYRARAGQPPSLPATETLARRILTLPLFPDMTDEEQDWVIACLVPALR